MIFIFAIILALVTMWFYDTRGYSEREIILSILGLIVFSVSVASWQMFRSKEEDV